MMKRRMLLMALLLAYWSALFTATHLPGGHTVGRLSHYDKLVHCLSFAGLACFAAAFVASRRAMSPVRCAVLFFLLATYALFDELLQVPIPGRDGDVLDWLADVCGVALGLAAYVGGAWLLTACRTGEPGESMV